MDRSERENEVQFLADCFKKTALAVCADYRGLTVAQVTALRKELKNVGATARVVKNTLARLSLDRAFKDDASSELAKFKDTIVGPTFLVYSEEDPVAPTKVLAKHAKDIECFKLKGAFFEGKFLDEKNVVELSKMPGKEEILGTLLRLIQTPATQVVRVLQAPSEQVTRVIEAQRKKLAA